MVQRAYQIAYPDSPMSVSKDTPGLGAPVPPEEIESFRIDLDRGAGSGGELLLDLPIESVQLRLFLSFDASPAVELQRYAQGSWFIVPSEIMKRFSSSKSVQLKFVISEGPKETNYQITTPLQGFTESYLFAARKSLVGSAAASD